MDSSYCSFLQSDAEAGLNNFGRNEQPLRKIEHYPVTERQCQNVSSRENSFVNFMQELLPETDFSRIFSHADGSSHEFSLRSPNARLLRRSTSNVKKHPISDTRLLSSTSRGKRQRSEQNQRSSSPDKSESELSERYTSYDLNGDICDDSDCEIASCSESGCQREIVVCNYGNQCSAPDACRKDCFYLQDTRLNSPRRQWHQTRKTGFARKIKSSKLHQSPTSSNYMASASPSPTSPLPSNNSTMYSTSAGLPTSDGSFSPKNSYQDQSDSPLHNFESYYPQSTGSTPCEILNQSWNSSKPFSENHMKPLSFQCPWLDCSRTIETSEQWDQHFHQEHIDPQMVYTCPLQNETCSFSMNINPLAHLEIDHGFSMSLDNENRYRCPSETCQEGLELFDQMSFHNHLDHVHATPGGNGQLQCRLWACGNWFDDPNELVSHAMQIHTIPVWHKPDEDQISNIEPDPENIQIVAPTETNQASTNKQQSKDLQAIKEIANQKLILQLEKPAQQLEKIFSNTSPPQKSVHIIGAEKLASHKCLWKSTRGIVCDLDFCSENELQNHIKESHLESLDSKTGYFCHWDGCMRESKLGPKAGFSQRGKLERHMATHTNFKCSLCDICGVSFSAPQAMRQHRRLHTGERPWKCQHCDKTFTQQSACTVHERTHTNEKPLECPICLKRFSESSNLTKHRKTHGEKGAHVCTFERCGKTFHRLDQLKRHTLTHLNNTKSI